MTPGPISLQAAAALYMAILERRGVTFALRDDGYHFHCELNGSDVSSDAEAADIAENVLLMRDEIRGLLLAQRVRH